MTARELRELRNRIPKDAWSEWCDYDGEEWMVEGENVSTNVAIEMFISSMVRWLCRKVPLITINILKDGGGGWAVGVGTKGEVRWAPTLVEALALLVESVVRKESAPSADGKPT